MVCVMFLMGVIVGSVVTNMLYSIHKIGHLKIVQQDDGGPFVFLESTFPLDAVKKKKYIVMDVIVGPDASRK